MGPDSGAFYHTPRRWRWQMNGDKTTEERPMGETHILITHDVLSVETANQLAGDDGAGAIALFVGTTRDNFNGRAVVQLEYEAFVPMAEKELRKIADQARQGFGITHVVLHHRLGVVPVREASVIVAVSSPHRREAIEAMHFTIDALKAKVPIWKKEVYIDGSEWKANKPKVVV